MPEIKEKPKTISTLESIGTLLLPASITYGACQTIFGLENLDSLIFGGGALLVTLCIFFRGWINRRVHAVWPIIVLVALASSFLYAFKAIILKDTGLIAYKHNSLQIQPYVRDGIEKSEVQSWFYGANFHISLPANMELYLKKLEDDHVDIRFLVHNPYSENVAAVAASFDQSIEQYVSECELAITSLRELLEKYNRMETHADLEIKFYDGIPRMRGYIFDPKNPKATSIFVPYHLDDSTRLPGFVFENSEDGVVQDYYPLILESWNAIPDAKINVFPKPSVTDS